MTMNKLARLIADEKFLEMDDVKTILIAIQSRCRIFEVYVAVHEFISGETKLNGTRKPEGKP